MIIPNYQFYLNLNLLSLNLDYASIAKFSTMILYDIRILQSIIFISLANTSIFLHQWNKQPRNNRIKPDKTGE